MTKDSVEFVVRQLARVVVKLLHGNQLSVKLDMAVIYLNPVLDRTIGQNRWILRRLRLRKLDNNCTVLVATVASGLLSFIGWVQVRVRET